MLSAVMSIHLLKRESNVAKTDFKKHIQIYKSKLELLSILVSDLSGRTHSFIEEKKIKGKSIRRSYRVQWSLSVVRRHIKKLYQLTNEDLAIDKSELDVSENTYKLFSKKAVSKAIIELKENLKVKNALKTEITEFTELHDNLFSQYKLILKIYNDLENITEEQYNILKKLIAKEGHLLIDIRKSEQEVVPIFRLYSRIKKKAMRNIMVLYHAYPAGSNPMIPHPLVRGSVVSRFKSTKGFSIAKDKSTAIEAASNRYGGGSVDVIKVVMSKRLYYKLRRKRIIEEEYAHPMGGGLKQHVYDIIPAKYYHFFNMLLMKGQIDIEDPRAKSRDAMIYNMI